MEMETSDGQTVYRVIGFFCQAQDSLKPGAGSRERATEWHYPSSV